MTGRICRATPASCSAHLPGSGWGPRARRAPGRDPSCAGLPSSGYLETYAKHHRWADARHHRRRYIEQVERPAVGVALTQRLSLRLRAANPWVIDSLLATAFPCLVLVTHLAATDSAVKYHDANPVPIFLAVGVAVRDYSVGARPLPSC
jgi:hypothetical protein